MQQNIGNNNGNPHSPSCKSCPPPNSSAVSSAAAAISNLDLNSFISLRRHLTAQRSRGGGAVRSSPRSLSVSSSPSSTAASVALDAARVDKEWADAIRLNRPLDVFAMVLSCPLLDPSKGHPFHIHSPDSQPLKSCITWAASNGHTSLVRLLLTDSRVDPGIQKNLSLRRACLHGHTEIVKLLLDYDSKSCGNFTTTTTTTTAAASSSSFSSGWSVDPAAEDNEAIVNAAQGGASTLAVLKLLLLDPRVNPACRRNLPLIYAATTGLPAAISLLLSDPRIDPSDCDNYAVRIAAQRGHVPALRLLLGDVRVDPTAKRSQAIREAASLGRTDALKFLLRDGRADPAAEKNEAIREACRNGHTPVVQLLLADPRVNPSDGGNEALLVATRHGFTDIVEDLLASDRVVFGLECPVLHEALVGDKDIGSSRILGKHVSGYNWTTGEMSLLPATSNGTVAGTTVTPSTAGGTICASVANNNNINTSGVFSSSTINATTTNTSSQPPPPPAPTLPQLSGSWPHEDIFRLILTSRPNSVNPAASENLAIRVASMWGLIDMIHLLLADPRVDCEAADHESVRSASDGRVLYDSLGMERSVVHRNVLDVLFARYVRKHGMDVAMDVWREIARQENEFGSPMLKEVCEDVFSEAKKRLLKK